MHNDLDGFLQAKTLFVIECTPLSSSPSSSSSSLPPTSLPPSSSSSSSAAAALDSHKSGIADPQKHQPTIKVEEELKSQPRFLVCLTPSSNGAKKKINEFLHVGTTTVVKQAAVVDAFIGSSSSSARRLIPILPTTYSYGEYLAKSNSMFEKKDRFCHITCTKCISCRLRVKEMYMYEAYQRIKQFGADNICAVEYITVTDGGGSSDSVDLDDNHGNENDENVENNNDQQLLRFQWSETLQIKYETYELQQSFKQEEPISVDDCRLDPFIIDFKTIQNANHYYVAVSRAKKQLRLNHHAWNIMQWLERDIGGIRTRLQQILGIDL